MLVDGPRIREGPEPEGFLRQGERIVERGNSSLECIDLGELSAVVIWASPCAIRPRFCEPMFPIMGSARERGKGNSTSVHSRAGIR